MAEYFQRFYMELAFGPGYILTELIFASGIVFIFDKIEVTRRGIAKILGRIGLLCVLSILLSSVYYYFLDIDNMNRVITILLVGIYGLAAKQYPFVIRMIRGSVYYTCYFQILTISEPLGRWLGNKYMVHRRHEFCSENTCRTDCGGICAGNHFTVFCG